MFHIAPKLDIPKDVTYSDLKLPSEEAPVVFETQDVKKEEKKEEEGEDVLPEAPKGFIFHKIKQGDTLMSLSVKYNISQNRIHQYNRQACFGHRLTHMSGKLLLIPLNKEAKLTLEIQQNINELNLEEKIKQLENNEDDDYKEPDELGKYQLRKAFLYHAKNCDDFRAEYYLGETHWNVRKALDLYQKDDKWEKQTTVSKTLNITVEEAKNLLDMNSWDISYAISYWKKNTNSNKISHNDKKDKALLEAELKKEKNINSDNMEGNQGLSRVICC